MEIQKSTKMKFGEEESQGSGRKKVFMRKVIVTAKRGQKLKGPRAIVTRIDDFLNNFHVEGGKRKSINLLDPPLTSLNHLEPSKVFVILPRAKIGSLLASAFFGRF